MMERRPKQKMRKMVFFDDSIHKRSRFQSAHEVSEKTIQLAQRFRKLSVASDLVQQQLNSKKNYQKFKCFSNNEDQNQNVRSHSSQNIDFFSLIFEIKSNPDLYRSKDQQERNKKINIRRQSISNNLTRKNSIEHQEINYKQEEFFQQLTKKLSENTAKRENSLKQSNTRNLKFVLKSNKKLKLRPPSIKIQRDSQDNQDSQDCSQLDSKFTETLSPRGLNSKSSEPQLIQKNQKCLNCQKLSQLNKKFKTACMEILQINRQLRKQQEELLLNFEKFRQQQIKLIQQISIQWTHQNQNKLLSRMKQLDFYKEKPIFFEEQYQKSRRKFQYKIIQQAKIEQKQQVMIQIQQFIKQLSAQMNSIIDHQLLLPQDRLINDGKIGKIVKNRKQNSDFSQFIPYRRTEIKIKGNNVQFGLNKQETMPTEAQYSSLIKISLHLQIQKYCIAQTQYKYQLIIHQQPHRYPTNSQ